MFEKKVVLTPRQDMAFKCVNDGDGEVDLQVYRTGFKTGEIEIVIRGHSTGVLFSRKEAKALGNMLLALAKAR